MALVVIGGLAVGAAIGTALRHLFGEARAVRAEETAVQGVLALRQTRQDTEAALGRALTAAERRKMFDAYEAHLRALGFTRTGTGWHRTRTGLEKLLG
mgnify:CR=1 FL=1